MRLGELAEDQHGQAGVARLDGHQGVDPAAFGHGDVKHHDIDLLATGHVDRVMPVAAFCHHLDVRLVCQELAQTRAHHRVIIDDGDPDHGMTLAGPSKKA